MDGLHDHPALADLPPKQALACLGLLALAESWARARGTYGVLPTRQVELLGGSQALAGHLVASGLWERLENGYAFRDWPAPTPPPSGTTEVIRAYEASRKREQRARGKQAASVPDGGLGGALNSDSDLSSDPIPLSSEITELSGGNAGAREFGPEPGRLRFELEELVRAAFSERGVTTQKASAGQWLDGCRTVQEALDKRFYPDARTALEAFARKLVAAVAAKKPPALGLALQQVQLGEEQPAGKELSPLALDRLRRRHAPPEMG